MTAEQSINDHKARYPEQYVHPLCGKRVKVRTFTGHETEGVVERVVACRFGLIAMFEGDNIEGWAVRDCTPVDERKEA